MDCIETHRNAHALNSLTRSLHTTARRLTSLDEYKHSKHPGIVSFTQLSLALPGLPDQTNKQTNKSFHRYVLQPRVHFLFVLWSHFVSASSLSPPPPHQIRSHHIPSTTAPLHRRSRHVPATRDQALRTNTPELCFDMLCLLCFFGFSLGAIEESQDIPRTRQGCSRSSLCFEYQTWRSDMPFPPPPAHRHPYPYGVGLSSLNPSFLEHQWRSQCSGVRLF